jgi:hypothetical protein
MLYFGHEGGFFMPDKPESEPEVSDARHEDDLKKQANQDASNAVDFMSAIMAPFIEVVPRKDRPAGSA